MRGARFAVRGITIIVKISSHKDLEVWKKGVDFAQKIYEITRDFPKDEIYGLSSQMRRSSVSISSNIAEGKNRGSVGDYVRFLYISIGSCAELETQIEICKRLGYIDDKIENDLAEMADHISRMLTRLIQSLQLSARTAHREPRTDQI